MMRSWCVYKCKKKKSQISTAKTFRWHLADNNKLGHRTMFPIGRPDPEDRTNWATYSGPITIWGSNIYEFIFIDAYIYRVHIIIKFVVVKMTIFYWCIYLHVHIIIKFVVVKMAKTFVSFLECYVFKYYLPYLSVFV